MKVVLVCVRADRWRPRHDCDLALSADRLGAKVIRRSCIDQPGFAVPELWRCLGAGVESVRGVRHAALPPQTMRWLLHVPYFIAGAILLNSGHSAANAMRVTHLDGDWSGLSQRRECLRQSDYRCGRHEKERHDWHNNQQKEDEKKSTHDEISE